MKTLTIEALTSRIAELESRLAEAEQLIDAIKGGEVDAFALNKNNRTEVFTLHTGDYAYRVLVENFSEGAVNLSEEGLIVYTNSSFPEMLKLPYRDVIGNSIFQFVDADSRVHFEELFRQGLTGQSKGEVNFVSANKICPAYVSFTTLFPTLPTVGLIITDLSEKKEHEKMLLLQNIELKRMNKELEAFTYISSHDLQEPLRKIQTFAGRILSHEQQHFTEKGKDYFKRMKEAAMRMQTLIQDLLNFSRLTTSERKFEVTDLNEILEEVKAELAEVIESTGATIDATNLGKARIIPFQFRQLIVNLVSNALKFAKEGQPPHIIIRSDFAKGSELNNANLLPELEYFHISVSDNGIGFESRHADLIFDVFQKLHSRDQYPGTGIGLANVKKIAENHQGIVTATGQLGQGATFDIYLPA